MLDLIKRIVVPAIVGTAAAVATTSALKPDPQVARGATDDAETPLKSTSTYVLAQDPTQDGRLSALEQRLIDLEAAEQSTQPQAAEAPAEPAVDPEQAAAEARQLRRRYIEEHEQQPPDPQWAPGAEQLLYQGLDGLADELGFMTLEAECRTDRCRATVRWDSYAEAMEDGAQLVERAIDGLNCGRSIWFDEPEDEGAETTAEMFVDCSEQRARIVPARDPDI